MRPLLLLPLLRPPCLGLLVSRRWREQSCKSGGRSGEGHSYSLYRRGAVRLTSRTASLLLIADFATSVARCRLRRRVALTEPRSHSRD
jgi:hypothetical protein